MWGCSQRGVGRALTISAARTGPRTRRRRSASRGCAYGVTARRHEDGRNRAPAPGANPPLGSRPQPQPPPSPVSKPPLPPRPSPEPTVRAARHTCYHHRTLEEKGSGVSPGREISG
ncbi:hypothetical protein P7K49_010049, partial [Saguinus oedipus]